MGSTYTVTSHTTGWQLVGGTPGRRSGQLIGSNALSVATPGATVRKSTYWFGPAPPVSKPVSATTAALLLCGETQFAGSETPIDEFTPTLRTRWLGNPSDTPNAT